MSELFKVALLVGGVALTMYITQAEQSYKIAAVEKSIEAQINSINETRKDITRIQVDLAKVAARDCFPQSHSKAWEQKLTVK